jgi:hypothetical protein
MGIRSTGLFLQGSLRSPWISQRTFQLTPFLGGLWTTFPVNSAWSTTHVDTALVDSTTRSFGAPSSELQSQSVRNVGEHTVDLSA